MDPSCGISETYRPLRPGWEVDKEAQLRASQKEQTAAAVSEESGTLILKEYVKSGFMRTTPRVSWGL